MTDVNQQQTAQEPSDPSDQARKPYKAPRLEIFGAVSALTRSGTISCMGDNPTCDVSTSMSGSIMA